MIHVTLQPEPADFDERVRQPGNEFLNECPAPNSTQFNKHSYWSRCSDQLYSSYGGICAYTGLWFSKASTKASVDHYLPKSRFPEKAYEWDNYRLTTPSINNYKSDKDVLDPFVIDDGDFVIDFPSCLLKPNKALSPSMKSKVKQTIAILHLNSEERANERCEIVLSYIGGLFGKEYLEYRYPIVAKELERQDLFERIKDIMIIPGT